MPDREDMIRSDAFGEAPDQAVRKQVLAALSDFLDAAYVEDGATWSISGVYRGVSYEDRKEASAASDPIAAAIALSARAKAEQGS